MRLIIDLTKASSNTTTESTPKSIEIMDAYSDSKIRPRRPLHNRAWELNVFYNQNLLPGQMASIQQERSQQKPRYLNDIQDEEYEKFFARSTIDISGYDGSENKYPISVIRNGEEHDVNKTKNSQPLIDKESWRKHLGKLYQGFDEYFNSTTLHGLKYVGDNSLSIFERLFWLSSFICGSCFAIFFIVSIYQKFNTSPMVISFSPKLVFLSEIPFPAITICNVNLALKTKAEEIANSNSSTNKKLLADLCNSKPKDNEYYDNSTKEWSIVEKFIIDVNQKCDDMLKLCKWNGTRQECNKLLNPVLTDEGYCCSFNSLPLNMSLRDDYNDTGYFPPDIINWNPEDGYGATPLNFYPYRSEGQGQSLGLTLALDAQLKYYNCTSTNSIGFKILLSDPTERPKIAEIGFLLSPGDETRISILPDVKEAVSDVRGLHIDKRQCYFARERQLKYYLLYSEKNCRLECQANYTIERCNCVPFYLPRNSSTPICDKEKEKCSNEAKDVIDRFTPERLACRCEPGCNDVSYKIDTMSVGKITSKYITVSEDIFVGEDYRYFAENIAVVHFYFGTDKFTKQTKTVMYGSSEFLSNTGGLLGLFLGFSFLSAVEIFYFIFFRNPLRYYRNYQARKLEERKECLKRISNLPYMR